MSFWEQVHAAIVGGIAGASANRGRIALGLGLFVVSFVGSLALTATVLVRLPPDHLLPPPAPADPDAPPGTAATAAMARAPRPPWWARAGRNLGGVALVLIGIVLSLPGVPGQGLLTIACGLLLLDFQVNRRLLRRILRTGTALAQVNRLRARYRRAPLRLDRGGDTAAAAGTTERST